MKYVELYRHNDLMVTRPTRKENATRSLLFAANINQSRKERSKKFHESYRCRRKKTCINFQKGSSRLNIMSPILSFNKIFYLKDQKRNEKREKDPTEKWSS